MLSGTTPAYLRDAERRENALAMGEEQREAYEVLDYHQIIDHENAIDMLHSPNEACSGFIYGEGGALFFGLSCCSYLFHC